jgi:hypothetical protein
VLQPFLPSILEGLVQLAAQFSSEVLTLVMETLCIVCTVDAAFTTSAENKICPLTIAIFLKYNNGTGGRTTQKRRSTVHCWQRKPMFPMVGLGCTEDNGFCAHCFDKWLD